MSLDPNRLILTGENPFIRLSDTDGGAITTNASFWRILVSPAGAGHVLYLKSDLTQDRWKIYSDNIAMARWLQKTVQGMLNDELSDTSIPVTDAAFDKMGDARDFWTERAVSHDEEVALTWYDIGEPLLIHTQPGPPPARKYGVCTVLIPALGARLTVNGVQAKGRPFPDPTRGQTVQHLRPGFLRKLDRGALTPSVVAVEPLKGLMTQPRNRAVGDIVGAGNVAHRLPGVAAAKGLLDLMGSQLRRSGADQLALKLPPAQIFMHPVNAPEKALDSKGPQPRHRERPGM